MLDTNASEVSSHKWAMNPNSRYEGPNILLELKQARADLRQACQGEEQLKKSQAERHIWALKGLYKVVTKGDPPDTENESELSGLEQTEEETTKQAKAFIKKTKLRRSENSSGSRSISGKRKLPQSHSRSRTPRRSKEDNTDNSQSESSESTENNKEDNTDSSQSESSKSTESNDEEDEEKDAKPNKRNKFRCPLRSCGSKVCKLPRHLKNVHGWSAERARNAVNKFDMRHDQRNSKKPKEVRNKRRRKVCCECGRKQKYLSKHLQKQHGYIQGTKRYWRALKESRPVYQSSASLAQNFVEIEGDSPSEEASETSNQFKESKKIAAPRGHVNDDTGTLRAASSTSTVDKVIVVESASDGEDDLEYLEECEESDDAVEVQTEACDQQSKRVFEAFEKWILSPDGGEKDARPAALVVRQVQTILSIIGTQTVESLFDKALIRDKFYPASRASHKAATTISYLHSLRKFYTFATTEDDIGLPRGCEKTADALFQKCGQWCKSLRKEVKERFWEKQEEDLARLITPEKVQEFAKSEFARNQVKVIGDLIDKGQNSTPLGQIEYCDLRNFLFIHLLSQNGHRSGVITNSTIDEYKEMSCVDETYMISVKDHKTYSQHGPANLCCDESLKSWLDIYVEHARQQVVKGGGSTSLFLNWKGAKMQSSDLSSAITSAWRKGGMIDKETRISGTLMRKSCTTAIRQYNKEVKGNVAAHMAHTERTADKHYHLVQKRTNSAFAARQLTAVMHGRPSSPAVPSRGKNDEIEQPCMRKDDFNSPPEGKEDGDLDAVPVPPVRQTWTKEEERAIKETFADNISRQSITLREVLALKRTNPLLVDCENKRLLDKVRGLYRFKKSQGSLFEDVEASDCNDNASDSNSIISPTTTQGKSRVFEEEEVMVFSNLFKDLIQGSQKIESKDVVQRLNDSGHKDIIQKYSKQKVTDKIRGLRATHIRQWRK